MNRVALNLEVLFDLAANEYLVATNSLLGLVENAACNSF